MLAGLHGYSSSILDLSPPGFLATSGSLADLVAHLFLFSQRMLVELQTVILQVAGSNPAGSVKSAVAQSG